MRTRVALLSSSVMGGMATRVAMGLEAVESCPRKRGHATQNGLHSGKARANTNR